MSDDAKIADLARRWVAAEAERRQRKREFGYAMVMLKKVGHEWPQPPEGDRTWEREDGVPQERFEFFLKLMRDAYKRRQDAANVAGALRGALTRACRSGDKPAENAEIMERYGELCAMETAQDQLKVPPHED